jgi:hypothetical protein
MKVWLLLFALGFGPTLVLLSVSAKGATHPTAKALCLRGQVKSVEIEANPSSASAFIRIKLQVEFVNTGTEPIILLRRTPSFVAAALAKEPSDFESGKVLAADGVWPAHSIAPEWAALRAQLDKPRPSDETRVLLPNESWSLETVVGVDVPVDPSRYTSSRKKESLQVIQQLSPLWLRITSEVWPWNLEETGAERENLSLGHKLQKRWRGVGLLWLDTIYSEPIMLDLKKVQP